jgi:hypothetical protein
MNEEKPPHLFDNWGNNNARGYFPKFFALSFQTKLPYYVDPDKEMRILKERMMHEARHQVELYFPNYEVDYQFVREYKWAEWVDQYQRAVDEEKRQDANDPIARMLMVMSNMGPSYNASRLEEYKREIDLSLCIYLREKRPERPIQFLEYLKPIIDVWERP